MKYPNPNGASASETESRYERGLDILLSLSQEKRDIVSNRLAEVAPDFARLVIEYAFGAILSRDMLDIRMREMLAIAVLTASGNALVPLRAHIVSALELGISREEVIEAIMQVSIYAGFPVVIDALTSCHDLLTCAPDGHCATCPDVDQRTVLGQS